MASGRITSVSLTRAYLRRIEDLDVGGPALNAVRCVNPAALEEAAAADARRAGGGPGGPLLGIPVLVKDNIDVLGMPTTACSVVLAGSYPAQDAPLVTRLRDAGAVILGKANLTEFANYLTVGMPSGYSSLAGQVLNPYDLSETPSGSSAGSGVAAAAGLAAVTLGTETDGSILSPASATSGVGVKPTLGLVSRTGIVPIASSQDTAGPMTRTVADAAALLTVVTGTDPEDPATAANPLEGHDFTADLSPDALRGARIGVVAEQTPEDGTDERALWDAALDALARRGAELVDVGIEARRRYDVASPVLSHEFKRDLNAYLARLPEGAPVRTLADVIAHNEAHADLALKFGQTLALAAQARDLGPDSADTVEYKAARARDLAESKDRIDALMAEHDFTALLFVNSGSSSIGAKAGYPSVTVPAGYLAANRRPFNITFLGRAWSEPLLLGYAYDYEQATRLRRPPSAVNPTMLRRRSPAVPAPRAADAER
ncbi:amidase family protein [Actinacidiphila glaucinigra]|uniref:amidase family protein n=1 Tax=Actinacidiphila glaucinigra TaxID=235986 RepID=UPI00368A160C